MISLDDQDRILKGDGHGHIKWSTYEQSVSEVSANLSFYKDTLSDFERFVKCQADAHGLSAETKEAGERVGGDLD